MDEIVQPAAVSEGTPATQEVTPAPVGEIKPTEIKPETKPETQPLTAEAIAKMVAEQVATQTEAARREIQSVKDKAKAEAENAIRKAQIAETTLNQVRSKLKESDPSFAQELEIAELRTKDLHYQQREKEEQMRAQQAQFDASFKANLTQFITGLGADPKDQRIDWGDDARDYLEKQNRILNSVVKLQKEDVKKQEEKRSAEVKEIELRLRKELGIDTVDTSMPAASPGTFGEIEAKYSRGEISTAEYTKERKKAGLT